VKGINAQRRNNYDLRWSKVIRVPEF
jgi:hypothetical protein